MALIRISLCVWSDQTVAAYYKGRCIVAFNFKEITSTVYGSEDELHLFISMVHKSYSLAKFIHHAAS